MTGLPPDPPADQALLAAYARRAGGAVAWDEMVAASTQLRPAWPSTRRNGRPSNAGWSSGPVLSDRTLAHGRDYDDIPPLKGVILSDASRSTMRVRVDVSRV